MRHRCKRRPGRGASYGGGAAEASVESGPDEIDRLVLLAHPPIEQSGRMKGRKLLVLSRDDASGDNKIPRLPRFAINAKGRPNRRNW